MQHLILRLNSRAQTRLLSLDRGSAAARLSLAEGLNNRQHDGPSVRPPTEATCHGTITEAGPTAHRAEMKTAPEPNVLERPVFAMSAGAW
ncbi:hypothetical protein CesoFtcFv8_002317 [Champsocephalus esox]|uniref:Uncharacterized protein n=2 Tax=Channichthyidae TaxID=30806 RepID=A0AAN8HHG1_9TELE|nr:hypothetical protein KUCAC02_029998 [Chaenocephalus aceratus]KAK5912444.1 hypothetical protein CesoFtcFv8_002317 [Champsocephalus esox]